MFRPNRKKINHRSSMHPRSFTFNNVLTGSGNLFKEHSSRRILRAHFTLRCIPRTLLESDVSRYWHLVCRARLFFSDYFYTSHITKLIVKNVKRFANTKLCQLIVTVKHTNTHHSRSKTLGISHAFFCACSNKTAQQNSCSLYFYLRKHQLCSL